MPEEYPYAQQEAQLLAQIAARRKAYMQRYGRAEQQFTGNAGKAGNVLGDQYSDPGDGDDLFKGDLLN
jgi:hypothetical protein